MSKKSRNRWVTSLNIVKKLVFAQKFVIGLDILYRGINPELYETIREDIDFLKSNKVVHKKLNPLYQFSGMSAAFIFSNPNPKLFARTHFGFESFGIW